MKKILKNNIAVCIYAMLTCFFLTFKVSSDSIILFDKNDSSFARTCIFLLLFIGYYVIVRKFTEEYRAGFYIVAVLLSAFCSFASVMGVFYSAAPRNGAMVGFDVIFGSGYKALIKFMVVFLGGFAFFCMLIGMLGIMRKYASDKLFPKMPLKKTGMSEKSWVNRLDQWLWSGKSFLKTGVCIAILWLPHIIIRYPGIVTVDSEVSLKQYYGVYSYTTQHPIIYMQLLGRFTDFGKWLGSESIGLFLITLLQGAALLLAMVYMLDTMKKFQAPKWLLNVTLFLIGVAPVFTGYITALVIDVFYDAFIVLLMIELVWYLFDQKIYLSSWKHPALTAAAVLGMFFRRNGLYVVAVVFVFVAGRELYLLVRKKQNKRAAVIILLALFVPMLAGKINETLLYKKYNANQISTRAMLAIPMQQLGRYMLNNGDDLTKEESEAIQAVMTYDKDEYAEKYRPHNMDGVKWGFNNDATSEEKSAFFQTWFKLLQRHPDTFINATLNQNYCLFSPLKSNVKYYDSVRDSLLEIKEADFEKVYEQNNSNGILKRLLSAYYRRFCDIPLLGLYVNQGLMDFLLLAVCLYCLFDKNGRMLLAALPMLLTLAVTFVGPAAMGHPRYTFPIFYALPLLTGLFLKKGEK